MGPRTTSYYAKSIKDYMLHCKRVRALPVGWAQVNGLRGEIQTVDKT